jgi:hypothetical protein
MYPNGEPSPDTFFDACVAIVSKFRVQGRGDVQRKTPVGECHFVFGNDDHGSFSGLDACFLISR